MKIILYMGISVNGYVVITGKSPRELLQLLEERGYTTAFLAERLRAKQ